MRVVGRRRTVDGVAAGVRGHGHHGHAVCKPAIDGLEIHVIERFLQQHGSNGVDEISVRDLAVRGDARLGVLFVLAAQSHHQVGDGLAQQLVFFFVSGLEFSELLHAGLFEVARFGAEPLGFRVIERPHVRFRDGSDGPQHALLAAARARAVAGDQRIIVAPHHQQIAQRGGLGIRRVSYRYTGPDISAKCPARGSGRRFRFRAPR